mgnify:CR=1 FL=1
MVNRIDDVWLAGWGAGPLAAGIINDSAEQGLISAQGWLVPGWR